jgi:hypothetical protein
MGVPGKRSGSREGMDSRDSQPRRRFPVPWMLLAPALFHRMRTTGTLTLTSEITRQPKGWANPCCKNHFDGINLT